MPRPDRCRSSPRAGPQPPSGDLIAAAASRRTWASAAAIFDAAASTSGRACCPAAGSCRGPCRVAWPPGFGLPARTQVVYPFSMAPAQIRAIYIYCERSERSDAQRAAAADAPPHAPRDRARHQQQRMGAHANKPPSTQQAGRLARYSSMGGRASPPCRRATSTPWPSASMAPRKSWAAT